MALKKYEFFDEHKFSLCRKHVIRFFQFAAESKVDKENDSLLL